MSHIPKLSSELAVDIDELIPKIDNMLLMRRRATVGSVSFVDCLSGLIRKAKIIVENRANLPKSEWGKAAICRHSEDGLAEVIFVIEATVWGTARIIGKLESRIHNTLIHEFTHLLDPRPWTVRYRLLEKNLETGEWTDYYAQRSEFDAYCSEIILNILSQTEGQDVILQQWKTFLTEPIDAVIIGRYFQSPVHQTALRAWLQNDKTKKTGLMRLFKLRLYAALYP